jgi:malyl-CoA/(S)-citramalyl-CoA lyase
MLQSAAACAADAVFIDLEDAVSHDKKNEALMTALQAPADTPRALAALNNTLNTGLSQVQSTLSNVMTVQAAKGRATVVKGCFH